MGAPRRRDPTVRVALPDLPAVKAARAMAGAKLGRPFKMAALGDALEKSEVLAAARAALGGDGA
jgi:precorrin-3B methylase